MAVITFWNSDTGKTGQTYSALAIATYMAIEHNQKSLFISTKCNDKTSIEAFGINRKKGTIGLITGNKNSIDLESGIEGMSKLAQANRLTPEAITNYTKVIFNNRFELIPSPTDNTIEKVDYERIYASCENIINVAKRYYEFVFVDLNSGFDKEPTRNILNKSDIIIINIEQKIVDFENLKKLKKTFPTNKTMILINKYDRESKYSIKNIKRFLNDKQEIYTIPYYNLYTEAVQEGNVAELFLNPRIRNIKEQDSKEGFFISEIKRALNGIKLKLQELQMRA